MSIANSTDTLWSMHRAGSRRLPFLLVIACLFFPLAANAAAGFTPNSLVLSKENAVAGEEVSIHAAIFNSESKTVNGSVEFTVDEEPVGAQEFSLAAGEAKIVSVQWKATPGEHQFNAYIDGSNEIKLIAAPSLKVTIANPAPSEIEKYTSVLTNGVTSLLASSSPLVQSIAGTIYSTTESWREAGLAYLSESLKDATSSPAITTISTTSPHDVGQVLGTSTVVQTSEATDSFFSRARHATLSFLYRVFGTAVFFYPFFALVFFILLYIAKKTLTRPHD